MDQKSSGWITDWRFVFATFCATGFGGCLCRLLGCGALFCLFDGVLSCIRFAGFLLLLEPVDLAATFFFRRMLPQ
jgi:hypothetical protein